MSIIEASKNETITIYYKDATLRSNRDVFFSAWDQNGTVIFTDQPADGEIPDSGVYHYDITTPNTDSYMLVLATDNEDPEGLTIKVGSPTIERGFYLRGDLKEEVQMLYEIYDTSSTILDEGTLNNVANGFYSTGPTQSLAEPFFLQINESVDVK
jgi:hypothetical protein